MNAPGPAKAQPPVDPLWRKSRRKSRYTVALIAALGVHAAILFGWHQAQLVEPVEFGMQAADSSVEVSLVAAPVAPEPVQETPPVEPEPVVTPPPVDEQPVPEPTPVPEKEPEMTIPEPTPAPKPVAVQQPKQKPVKSTLPKPAPRTTRATGDGSSAKPGNDAITSQASSGALSAKPGYLRNPEPTYPEQARMAGQQGVVHLHVKVNAQGGIISVQVTHSSGYAILDERARSTVADRWIFKPARSNGVAIPSEVIIPIRFTLN